MHKAKSKYFIDTQCQGVIDEFVVFAVEALGVEPSEDAAVAVPEHAHRLANVPPYSSASRLWLKKP
jgi:hypothetical protein